MSRMSVEDLAQSINHDVQNLRYFLGIWCTKRNTTTLE